jgi:hypothetical protein
MCFFWRHPPRAGSASDLTASRRPRRPQAPGRSGTRSTSPAGFWRRASARCGRRQCSCSPSHWTSASTHHGNGSATVAIGRFAAAPLADWPGRFAAAGDDQGLRPVSGRLTYKDSRHDLLLWLGRDFWASADAHAGCQGPEGEDGPAPGGLAHRSVTDIRQLADMLCDFSDAGLQVSPADAHESQAANCQVHVQLLLSFARLTMGGGCIVQMPDDHNLEVTPSGGRTVRIKLGRPPPSRATHMPSSRWRPTGTRPRRSTSRLWPRTRWM